MTVIQMNDKKRLYVNFMIRCVSVSWKMYFFVNCLTEKNNNNKRLIRLYTMYRSDGLHEVNHKN